MKMNSFGRQTLTDFKTHYKMITVKTRGIGIKIDKMINETQQSPDKDLYIY